MQHALREACISLGEKTRKLEYRSRHRIENAKSKSRLQASIVNSLAKDFSYSAELGGVDGLRSSFGRLCCGPW